MSLNVDPSSQLILSDGDYTIRNNLFEFLFIRVYPTVDRTLEGVHFFFSVAYPLKFFLVPHFKEHWSGDCTLDFIREVLNSDLGSDAGCPDYDFFVVFLNIFKDDTSSSPRPLQDSF
jgi:hypothetical protein